MNEIWFPIRIQSGIESRSNFYFLPGDMLVPKSNILREMKEVLENSKKFYNDYPNEENKMTVESIEKNYFSNSASG